MEGGGKSGCGKNDEPHWTGSHQIKSLTYVFRIL